MQELAAMLEHDPENGTGFPEKIILQTNTLDFDPIQSDQSQPFTETGNVSGPCACCPQPHGIAAHHPVYWNIRHVQVRLIGSTGVPSVRSSQPLVRDE